MTRNVPQGHQRRLNLRSPQGGRPAYIYTHAEASNDLTRRVGALHRASPCVTEADACISGVLIFHLAAASSVLGQGI